MISTINQPVIPENILLDRFRHLTIEQQRMLVDFIEFIGCVDGGSGDLATNKKYLEV